MDIEQENFTADEVYQLLSNIGSDLAAMAKREDKTLCFAICQANRLRAETFKVLHAEGVVDMFATPHTVAVTLTV